jgi:hypothetical protein
MTESHTDTPLLTERFDEALVYASAHHRRQLRKGGDIPYTAHLLAVAAIALEMGCDEDEAIGALLHDVVEDGGGPKALEEIRERFGDPVAEIVQANSDTDVEPKPPWRQRKEDYIAAIAHKSLPALRVSLADKLHNARSILFDYRVSGERLWSRFKTGEGESVRWYYRELAIAFEARVASMGRGARFALDDLWRTINALDAEVAKAKIDPYRGPLVRLPHGKLSDFDRIDEDLFSKAHHWVLSQNDMDHGPLDDNATVADLVNGSDYVMWDRVEAKYLELLQARGAQ